MNKGIGNVNLGGFCTLPAISRVSRVSRKPTPGFVPRSVGGSPGLCPRPTALQPPAVPTQRTPAAAAPLPRASQAPATSTSPQSIFPADWAPLPLRDFGFSLIPQLHCDVSDILISLAQSSVTISKLKTPLCLFLFCKILILSPSTASLPFP